LFGLAVIQVRVHAGVDCDGDGDGGECGGEYVNNGGYRIKEKKRKGADHWNPCMAMHQI
jgi:hypothetical protein